MFLWQDTGLKNGKVLVLYIVSYFHDIRFQVDYVWNMRGPSFANLKENRGLKERHLAQRVTNMGPICISTSINHFSKYSL